MYLLHVYIFVPFFFVMHACNLYFKSTDFRLRAFFFLLKYQLVTNPVIQVLIDVCIFRLAPAARNVRWIVKSGISVKSRANNHYPSCISHCTSHASRLDPRFLNLENLQYFFLKQLWYFKYILYKMHFSILLQHKIISNLASSLIWNVIIFLTMFSLENYKYANEILLF